MRPAGCLRRRGHCVCLQRRLRVSWPGLAYGVIGREPREPLSRRHEGVRRSGDRRGRSGRQLVRRNAPMAAVPSARVAEIDANHYTITTHDDSIAAIGAFLRTS